MGCQRVKSGTFVGVGIGIPPPVCLQCGNLEILHQRGVDGGGECGPGRLLDMGGQHPVDVGAHGQGPLHGLCHTTELYHLGVVGSVRAAGRPSRHLPEQLSGRSRPTTETASGLGGGRQLAPELHKCGSDSATSGPPEMSGPRAPSSARFLNDDHDPSLIVTEVA